MRCAGECVQGRQGQLAVDTLGQLPAVHVTPANEQERARQVQQAAANRTLHHVRTAATTDDREPTACAFCPSWAVFLAGLFVCALLPALLAIPMFDDDLRTGIVLGTVMAQPWEEGGDAEETLHELFLVAP